MEASREGFVALGTLPGFHGGWAIVPFIQKPHYWIVEGWTTDGDIRIYRSRCGLWASSDGAHNPIVPGNFPKCKRCERSMTEPSK